MGDKVKKSVFVNGPISSEFIAKSIEKHSVKTEIGAHSIFLGQVREDIIEEKKVLAIEYTCYEKMADKIMYSIREETFSKFDLTCMHIYHSLGKVNKGEISLFIFTSSKHRKLAIDACSFVVEKIKSEIPVWGKEILEDQTHTWKSNN